MRRSAAHRIGACCLLAAGPLGMGLWEAAGRPLANGMNLLALLGLTTAGGLAWLLAADVIRRNRWDFPPGHCPRCGYDLRGNASGVCPECGTRRNNPERPE